VLLQENGVMKRVELPDDAKAVSIETSNRPPVTRAVPPQPGMQQIQPQQPQQAQPPEAQPQVNAMPEGNAPQQNFATPMGGMVR
jgi:hypothetical protein